MACPIITFEIVSESHFESVMDKWRLEGITCDSSIAALNVVLFICIVSKDRISSLHPAAILVAHDLN